MVKVKIPSEDKKDSTPRKKPADRKRASKASVWDCKIDGCNKQFAREADLKRHQRTTKVHSVPGFICPQCDATFTRTDALKRHQKSRHFGADFDHEIVVPEEEIVEPSSRGSSSAPSSKGKEKETDPPPAASHYYRNATTATAQFTLPTSSTRSNSDRGTPPVQYPPYYRPNSALVPSRKPSQTPLPAQDPDAETTATNGSEAHSFHELSSHSRSPNMDKLDGMPTTTVDPASLDSPEQQLRMQDIFNLAARDIVTSPSLTSDGTAVGFVQRPEPMEHILMEDGTPMLNPAELLTPESLASPPHP